MLMTEICTFEGDSTPGSVELICRAYKMKIDDAPTMVTDGRTIYLDSIDKDVILLAKGFIAGFGACTKICACVVRD